MKARQPWRWSGLLAGALLGCSFPEKRPNDGDAPVADAVMADAPVADAVMADAVMADAGPTWAWQVTETSVSARLEDVSGTAATDVYAVGQDGTIVHWNGSVWQSQETGTFLSLFGVWTNGGRSWAVGDRGVLVRSDVMGAWTSATAPTGADIYYYGVWGSSADDVYAVGLSGHILRHDGTTWTASIRGAANLAAIHGTAANDVYAVGDGGTIWRWQGGDWINEPSPIISDLRGVHAVRVGEAYAVGASGQILRRSAGQWNSLTSPTTVGLSDVYAVDGAVWAVGQGGLVLHSDGIAAFSQVAVPTTEDLFHVWVAPTGEVFAVGSNGTALRYGPLPE